MKYPTKPIKVARISKKNFDKLVNAGYIVIICGWGKINGLQSR